MRRSKRRSGRLSRRDDLGLLPLRRRGHSGDRSRQRHRSGARPALRARRRDRASRSTATTIVCWRRSTEPARDRIDLRTVDVSDEAAVHALIDDVRRKYPRLDAAVLGAAIQYRTDIDQMSRNNGARSSTSISMACSTACMASSRC